MDRSGRGAAGMAGKPAPKPSGHPLAIPAVALAAALWAVAGVVASELFDAGVNPLALAGARALVAALGLAVVPASWRGPRGDRRVRAVVALGLALALVTATYYLAIDRLPVAIGIVLQYTGPVLVVAWTAVVFRRAPEPRVTAALVGAIAGVVLVTGVAAGDLGRLDAIGILMGLGAAVTFAAYTVSGELVRASYGPLPALFRAFCIAAAFWLVVLLPTGAPQKLWMSDALGPVAFVGLAGTLAPFLLYVWAVAHVRAERASIAATLEPVLAAIFAWVSLGQTLSAPQVVGGGLVIASVVALQLFGAASGSPVSPRD